MCYSFAFLPFIISNFSSFRSTLTLNKGITHLVRLGEMGLLLFFLRRSCRAPADGREKCDYRVPKVRSITHYTPFCQELWLAGRRETELWETAISCLKSCPDICLRSSVKLKHIPEGKEINTFKNIFPSFPYVNLSMSFTIQ